MESQVYGLFHRIRPARQRGFYRVHNFLESISNIVIRNYKRVWIQVIRKVRIWKSIRNLSEIQKVSGIGYREFYPDNHIADNFQIADTLGYSR